LYESNPPEGDRETGVDDTRFLTLASWGKVSVWYGTPDDRYGKMRTAKARAAMASGTTRGLLAQARDSYGITALDFADNITDAATAAAGPRTAIAKGRGETEGARGWKKNCSAPWDARAETPR
jgi:hypothetical protein